MKPRQSVRFRPRARVLGFLNLSWSGSEVAEVQIELSFDLCLVDLIGSLESMEKKLAEFRARRQAVKSVEKTQAAASQLKEHTETTSTTTSTTPTAATSTMSSSTTATTEKQKTQSNRPATDSSHIQVRSPTTELWDLIST